MWAAPKDRAELYSAPSGGFPFLGRCGEVCGTDPPHPAGGKKRVQAGSWTWKAVENVDMHSIRWWHPTWTPVSMVTSEWSSSSQGSSLLLTSCLSLRACLSAAAQNTSLASLSRTGGGAITEQFKCWTTVCVTLGDTLKHWFHSNTKTLTH